MKVPHNERMSNRRKILLIHNVIYMTNVYFHHNYVAILYGPKYYSSFGNWFDASPLLLSFWLSMEPTGREYVSDLIGPHKKNLLASDRKSRLAKQGFHPPQYSCRTFVVQDICKLVWKVPKGTVLLKHIVLYRSSLKRENAQRTSIFWEFSSIMISFYKRQGPMTRSFEIPFHVRTSAPFIRTGLRSSGRSASKSLRFPCWRHLWCKTWINEKKSLISTLWGC